MFTERKYYFGHFRMPAVDHCDENQLESANGCYSNIVLPKDGKLAGYL